MFTIEGQIVNIDAISRGRIEIDPATGLIVKVGEPTGKADIVLDQELIFPGFVDLHVHARECAAHSQDYKEDFTTAGQAAINGGVVAFAEMPNNTTPPVDDASYEEKLLLAKKSSAEVVLYAGLGPATKPLAKKVPYKVYMGKSVGDLFFIDFETLDKALENYKGQQVSFHAEDPKILADNSNQSSHELKRPPEAENSAVDFALKMIEKYKLQGRICHLSTKAGLEKIIKAKKSGISVTCEVAPHHLYYDVSAKLQMNPPLRAKEDCLALIEGLRNGDIDFLATDHAPHTIEDKQKGASGLPLLDTYGPFITWLMQQHQFTPEDIARVCSFNPGNFISQFTAHQYGRIKEGFAGSLTVIDPNRPIKIEKLMLKTKCGWSPF